MKEYECANCGIEIKLNYDVDNNLIPCICGSVKISYGMRVDQKIYSSNNLSGSVIHLLTKRNSFNCQYKYRLGKYNFLVKYDDVISLSSEDVPILYLHEDFVNGTQNANLEDGKLIDFKNMNIDQLSLLHVFLEDLFFERVLYGTNKPSYEKDGFNYWHYHVGPYETSHLGYINNLNDENLNGKKSGPVIHYEKLIKAEKIIYIIIGFAIQHSGTSGFKKLSTINIPLN